MFHFTKEILENAMNHVGINDSQLAKLVGVTRAYIFQLRKGILPISPNMQKKLNKVFAGLVDEKAHMESIEQLKQILEGRKD
ncbi:helix-turn-helix transcriptional regulator [Bacillus haikouensis]|jgi:plasmid maintenance system antidote protein VapI|uniref:helix-turn-helix domain-containing protein n=1 Tax=Bacillus haikouensis TaxID=1510468 RepID=UPI001557243C|nr:helix-turn-helix transcriptional regulator [Bacillus haikouensis]NQD64315.1 helix-turn-helix transcriptional regulator [Bacillus haikouensis]